MELRHLKAFTAVARLLSFRKAAESLHYAQSSVSAQIKALEEELGTRLFDRLGRRIILTEAGERLLDYARKILDLEEEAQAEVTGPGEARASLTIRVPETFCAHRLAPVVRRFRSLLPRAGLRFIACALDSLSRDLRQGVTDLAFVLTDSIQAADLRAEVVGVESLLLAAWPGHPLAGRTGIETVDLAGQTLILSRSDCSYRRLLEQSLAQERVAPTAILELSSLVSVKEWVREGLGITIIPRIAVSREIEQGRLVALPWPEEELEVACLMVWHRDKWLSPALTAFMEVTRQVLGDSGGGDSAAD